MRNRSVVFVVGCIFLPFILLHCGKKKGSDAVVAVNAVPVFSIGGTVTGLTGTLVLQNNLTDTLTLTADGSFTFSTSLAAKSTYAVTVLTQPTEQTCSVSAGSGVIASEKITTVVVTCSTHTYAVGGMVTGISGTVVLQNNAGDNLSLSTGGDFTFATEVAEGGAYAVTVLTQPIGQTCVVTDGSGTLAGTAITNVAVGCSLNSYTVSGTINGLTGTIVLQNNNKNNTTIRDNGAFSFSLPIVSRSTYNVTVFTQPVNQNCTVTSTGVGTISGSNVTDVIVSCLPGKYFFITSSTFSGNLLGTTDSVTDTSTDTSVETETGIASADASCNTDINKPNESAYKAFLMDGTTRRACLSASCATSGTLEHIDWVLVPNTRYIRADGSTVIGTTDTNGLFTFPLTNSYLAFADATPGIWTGLTNEWQGTSYACNHWTQGDGASGIYASIEVTDVDAISSNNGSCSSLAHLACAEQ